MYCAALILRASAKTPLNELLERIPRVYTAGYDIRLAGYAGDVMELLCHRFAESSRFEDGLLTGESRGWVRITPLAGLRSLHIAAEAYSMEAAKELCGDMKEQILRYDSLCEKAKDEPFKPENSCTNP